MNVELVNNTFAACCCGLLPTVHWPQVEVCTSLLANSIHFFVQASYQSRNF
jgi:hypothetical protein